MDDREAARLCAERVMGWHIVDVEESAATGFAAEHHWSDGEHLIVGAENYNPRQNIAQAVELAETWRKSWGNDEPAWWQITSPCEQCNGQDTWQALMYADDEYCARSDTPAAAITNAVLAALENGGDL